MNDGLGGYIECDPIYIQFTSLLTLFAHDSIYSQSH
jgi:hypothetical protein